MATLDKFDKEALTNIIQKLGKAKRIFNSEAQFQFELGWKIKEQFDCKVKFEELSRIISDISKKGKPTSKKDYTDLILEKDNLRIAIELKYKTAKYDDINNNISLKPHGAADLGRYDFMWDIQRIQGLKREITKGQELGICCPKGYAVILTNDKHYWDSCPNNNVPQNITVIDKDFFIGEFIEGVKQSRTYIREGDHDWQKINGQTPKLSESRKNKITMTKDYPYQWEDYYKNGEMKNGVFRFLIVEVS